MATANVDKKLGFYNYLAIKASKLGKSNTDTAPEKFHWR